MLRSCYHAYMDFGDGNPVYVCWYFVDPGTPMLPFVHGFGSRNWEQDKEWIATPGEIYDTPRPYRNGRRCRQAPIGRWIGTPEQWQNGIAPGTPYVTELAPGVPDGTLSGSDRAHNAEAFDPGFR